MSVLIPRNINNDYYTQKPRALFFYLFLVIYFEIIITTNTPLSHIKHLLIFGHFLKKTTPVGNSEAINLLNHRKNYGVNCLHLTAPHCRQQWPGLTRLLLDTCQLFLMMLPTHWKNEVCWSNSKICAVFLAGMQEVMASLIQEEGKHHFRDFVKGKLAQEMYFANYFLVILGTKL